MFLLTQKHSIPIMPVPLSAAWCRGGGISYMKENTPTKVVTFLAIVWYVLEIIIKTVQLLR